MNEKPTIFDFFAQVLTIFGFTMLVLNLFCLWFGQEGQGFSALFALGSAGLPSAVVFQFFCVSVLVAGFRFLFFTDLLFKRLSIALRTAGMLAAVLATLVVFILAFRWFPAGAWQAWASFLLCFALSFFGSLAVMTWKESLENRRMEQALERLKKTGGA